MKKYSISILSFAFMLFFCITLSTPQGFAQEISIPEKVSQGRGFIVTIKDTAPFTGTIYWQNKTVAFSSIQDNTSHSAEILLGMPIDATKKQKLSLITKSGDTNKTTEQAITPLHVNWVTHKLNVAPKYVEPPKEVLDTIYKNQKTNKATLATISSDKYWSLPFTRPVKGTISGSFAARRVFNGQPRSPHLGTDMRGAIGTPILAMADGVVLNAEKQYFSGNAVWIDHGQGVISMYGHMSKMSVKTGDKIKQGQKIGEVGATGRVTGPHLHLSLYIQGVAVDAVPFFSQMPLAIIGGPTKEQARPAPKASKK